MEDSDHHVWCGGGGGEGRACESCCNCRLTNNSNNNEFNKELLRIRKMSRFNSRNSHKLNLFIVLFIGIVSIVLSHQGRILVSASESTNAAVISQSEVKTIEPTNNPTKVFVRRRIFRKLVKDTSGGNNSSSSSEEGHQQQTPPNTSEKPKTLYSLVKQQQELSRSGSPQSSTVTGNTLKSSMQSSQSLASKQKFNFQSLKTRLGLALTTTTTTSKPDEAASNSSLVMIPLPPNQRKPYTPVIMHVSKSTTPTPETKVQTFKLNKMFVPIGIYGKVVDNETSSTTAPSTEDESSTPLPSIRHKGTDSVSENGKKKGERKVKGIAESVDLTYKRTDPKLISLTTERPNIAGISITTESNDLFSSVFGGKDYSGLGGGGSSNGLRRGDRDQLYSSRYKNNGYGGNNGGGGLTLMTPPALGGQSDSSSSSSSQSLLDNYGSYSTYSNYNKHKYTPSSIVDSITDSMSRIPSLVPSLFHKGLTSLASMTSSLKENPFVDENFPEANLGMNKAKPLISLPSSYKHKIPASVPGGYIQSMNGGGHNSHDQAHAGSEIHSSGGKSSSTGGSGTIDPSEYETLEYFRKRPHLLAQLRRQHQTQSSWRRSQGVRFSKGFRPATVPDPIARAYYKSTSTTTASTPEEELLNAYNSIRKAKKMKGSWLLRNSNEYVSNKNDKLVSMWRSLLDTFTNDDEDEEETEGPQARSKVTTEPKSPPQSVISNRRSSSPSKSPRSDRQNPILSAQWSSIKKKYSKNQINEAKERILTLLNSGYGDELDHHPDGEVPLEDEHDLQLHYDTHMPPPPEHHLHAHHVGPHHGHGLPVKSLLLTKGLSKAATGAFKDLVKFFKLGVSVGTGQSREPVNYEQVVDEQEEQEVIESGGSGDWKPVLRQPLISFSAGISLKNPSSLKPKPHHHHHHAHHHHSSPHHHHAHSPQHIHTHHVEEVDLPVSTHYSSSSSPYIPSSYELSSSSPTSPTYSTSSYEASPDEVEAVGTGGQDDYEHEEEAEHSVPSKSYASVDDIYNYKKYETLKPKQKNVASLGEMDMEHSNTDWNPVSTLSGVPGSRYRGGSNGQDVYSPGLGSSSEYELVPSSVYLSGDHDPRDIAAVVKPAGVSDDLVRQTLPAGLRNLKILNYPHEYGSLNSISQSVLGGGASVGDIYDQKVSFKKAMKKLRDNYVAKESAYLPTTGAFGGDDNLATLGLLQQQQQYLSQQPVSQSLFSQLGAAGYYLPQQQPQQQIVPTSLFSTANRINSVAQLAQQQQQFIGGIGGDESGSSGKDSLGFTTNYNLPQHMDPDIAAILKSELDKDDIPEDVRQEFLEAKKEEEQKKLKQAALSQQQQNRRVDIAQQDLIDSLLSSAVKNRGGNQNVGASINQQYSVPSLQSVLTRQQQQPQQPRNPISANLHHNQQQTPIQSRAYNSPPPHRHQAPLPLHPPILTTKFFAPIPITPTLMTTALKNPRYASPVPRYVLELAKKLNTDSSVQGIVRVSAKRGRGLPPIEYLYPVKG